MRFIFIRKCLFIYFSLIYIRNLVESDPTSANVTSPVAHIVSCVFEAHFPAASATAGEASEYDTSGEGLDGSLYPSDLMGSYGGHIEVETHAEEGAANAATSEHVDSTVYEAHSPAASTTLVGDSSATPEIKLFKSDTSGKSVEMVEGTDFEKKKDDDGDDKYTFKDGVKCILVTCDDKEAWKHDSTRNDKYPISLSYNTASSSLIFKFDTLYTFYSKDKESNWTLTDPGLKLFAQDPSDCTKEIDLNTSGYEVRKDPYCKDFFYYYLTDDSKCTLVKLDNKDVWKYDASKHDGNYPKSLNFNLQTQELVVNLEKYIITVKKDANGTWQGITKAITGKGLLSLNANACSSDFKLYKQDPNDPNTTIELNNNDYDEIKLFGDVAYKFKTDVKCTLVKCGNEDVWKFDSGDYPKKVSQISSQNKICIEFNNNAKCYVKEDSTNNWKEITEDSSQTGSVDSTPA